MDHVDSVYAFLAQKLEIEVELHWAHYIVKFETHILKIQKNLKTILVLMNVVFYQHAKSQIKIIHIMGYTKIIKIWHICKSRNFALFNTFKCQTLSFFCSRKYKIFLVDFLHICTVLQCVHPIFVLDYFEI